jgi:type I restriction enzyme S subunit
MHREVPDRRSVWHDCTIGDLLEIKHGYAFLGEHFSNEGTHIVLTPGNFYEEGGFKQKGNKEKWYNGPVPADYVLNEGDLIVAMTEQGEGLLGSSAVIPRSGLYLHNQRLGLVLIRDEKQTDSKFLYYLFNSKSVRQQIRASASGVKIRHTAPSRIGEIKVSVPLFPLQQRIGEILSAYDDLIANNQRRIRILEEMARTLYREWFVNFRFPGHEKTKLVSSPLGNIPLGWEVGRLDDVLVLQRGFDLPKADRIEGTVPIYAATGVNGFHNKVKVKAPGVVTGRSGTIGDVLYVQEDFWPLNTALWVKEFPKAEPLYAYYVLSSVGLKQFNSGAAVPTLNRNDIHGQDALIPPRPLQKQFQENAGAMLAQTRTLELQIQNLRRTRDLLLPRLLSGKLSL